MKTSRMMLGLATMLLCAAASAQDASTTTPPTTEPAVISVSDKDALTAAVDKQATVEGTVASAQWATSGKVFIMKFKDADDSGFQAVAFSKNKDVLEKAFDGDLSKAIEGAKIRVSGKVQSFREHPEIVVNGAENITIVDKPAAATTAPAGG